MRGQDPTLQSEQPEDSETPADLTIDLTRPGTGEPVTAPVEEGPAGGTLGGRPTAIWGEPRLLLTPYEPDRQRDYVRLIGGRHLFVLDERTVEPVARGAPESFLRWTAKSTRKLAAELKRQGHRIGDRKVATELLRQMGQSLQATPRLWKASLASSEL